MPRTTELKVAKVKVRGKTRWRVTGPGLLSAVAGATRYRGPIRQTREEADEDFEKDQKRLFEIQGKLPTLTPAQTHDARQALLISADTGWSLERLVRLGMDYKAILETRKTLTFKEGFDRLIVALKQEAASEKHQRDARQQLRFAEMYALSALDQDMRDVDADAVRAWLAGLQCSDSTKAKWLRYAKMVFSRAVKEGFAEANTLKLVKAPKVQRGAVSFLGVDDSRRLLEAVSHDAMPVVALGLFAGLRPESELQRLTWADVDWERHEIHVAADRTKTARHRLVPMEPALIAWLDLAGARDRKGPVMCKGWRTRLDRAKVAASIVWVQDILRHTYATMWLAQHGNKGRLAENMGNSQAVIDQHYRFPISKAVAAEFWAIRPVDVTS